jgi:hypothetical protein
MSRLCCCANYVLACPVCDTATGQAVRRGILSADLAGNLLATLAPFPVLLFLVALLHFFPLFTRRNRKSGKELP